MKILKIGVYLAIFLFFALIVARIYFGEIINFSRVNTRMNVSQGSLKDSDLTKSKEEAILSKYKINNSKNMLKKIDDKEFIAEYSIQSKAGTVLKKIYKVNRFGKIGLIDENGNRITKFAYNDILLFDKQNGICKTIIGLKCGLVSFKKGIILPAKFEEIKKTDNPDVVLLKNSKYFGLFDFIKNNAIASPIYADIEQADKYNWKLYSGKLVGLVYSKNGNDKLISPKYENIKMYKNVYKSIDAEKEGLISNNGSIISEPIYDSIELINEKDVNDKNIMIFKTKIDNRYGVIYYAPYYSAIVSPIYGDVQYKGLVNVFLDGYWRILDNQGNVITK